MEILSSLGRLMRLGVDVRWMCGHYRGMGRFARQLISPVTESVIALAPRGTKTNEWPLVSSGNGFFPWWEQAVLPQLCKKQKLDILLCPYNSGPIANLGATRSIAVIHDLIFMQPWSVLPPSLSIYQTLGRLYRRHVVPTFSRCADNVITVSAYSKQELVDRIHLPESSIHVIPNSISDNWFAESLPFELRQSYIFSVSGESPSKNVSRLLKAFALACLESDDIINLKIAGIKPAFHSVYLKQAFELGINDQVEFLGVLSEQQLMNYYRNARGFILASLFEGFGIPLLEAMACGTPVACSNSTSMPEVVGGSGFLFDPFSIDDIAENILKLWFNMSFSSHSRCVIERATCYSDSSVRKMVESFWSDLS